MVAVWLEFLDFRRTSVGHVQYVTGQWKALLGKLHLKFPPTVTVKYLKFGGETVIFELSCLIVE